MGLLIPEGRERRGWKMLADELGKVVVLFKSSLGKLHGVFPNRHIGVLSASSSGPMVKQLFFSNSSGKGPFVEGSFLSFAKVVSTAESKPTTVKTLTEHFLGSLDKKNHVADGSFGQKSKPKARGTTPWPFRVAEGEVNFQEQKGKDVVAGFGALSTWRGQLEKKIKMEVDRALLCYWKAGDFWAGC